MATLDDGDSVEIVGLEGAVVIVGWVLLVVVAGPTAGLLEAIGDGVSASSGGIKRAGDVVVSVGRRVGGENGGGGVLPVPVDDGGMVLSPPPIGCGSTGGTLNCTGCNFVGDGVRSVKVGDGGGGITVEDDGVDAAGAGVISSMVGDDPRFSLSRGDGNGVGTAGVGPPDIIMEEHKQNNAIDTHSLLVDNGSHSKITAAEIGQFLPPPCPVTSSLLLSSSSLSLFFTRV